MVSEVKLNRYYSNSYAPDMQDFIGRVFTSVTSTDDTLTFKNDEELFKLYHEQDCCEHVYIEDICGDLFDLVDTPIIEAYESSNVDFPPPGGHGDYDSYTWTFYTFRTIKGSVTVRFFGTSNGYYSESVSLHYYKTV